MTDMPAPATQSDITPALFATIHFRSDRRPHGYTDDEIAELTELANAKSPSGASGEDGPA